MSTNSDLAVILLFILIILIIIMFDLIVKIKEKNEYIQNLIEEKNIKYIKKIHLDKNLIVYIDSSEEIKDLENVQKYAQIIIP